MTDASIIGIICLIVGLALGGVIGYVIGHHFGDKDGELKALRRVNSNPVFMNAPNTTPIRELGIDGQNSSTSSGGGSSLPPGRS